MRSMFLGSFPFRLPAMAAVCTVMLLAVSSAAGSIVTYGSDSEFLAASFTKQFGADVRWGNHANNGDWEYGLVNAANTATFAQGNVAWNTGTSNAHTVEFTYTPDVMNGVDEASLSLNGGALGTQGTLTSAVPDGVNGVANSVLIRVRDRFAPFSDLTGITITFGNGEVFDWGAQSNSLIAAADNAKYLGIVDDRIALGFTLTANATIDGGSSNSGSDPAYQFKVGTLVPEPTAIAIWGLLGVGLVASRRRRG